MCTTYLGERNIAIFSLLHDFHKNTADGGGVNYGFGYDGTDLQHPPQLLSTSQSPSVSHTIRGCQLIRSTS
jgi:hypothetical protein